jgi:hypothetical protein
MKETVQASEKKSPLCQQHDTSTHIPCWCDLRCRRRLSSGGEDCSQESNTRSAAGGENDHHRSGWRCIRSSPSH